MINIIITIIYIELLPNKAIPFITLKEHHLNYYAMLVIMTAGSIASWAFVTGGSIGILVPGKYGIAAALFGCAVAFSVHAYSAVVYTRWGTDMSVTGRSVWGHRGIYLIILGVGFPATYGWGSLPMIMLGKSAATVAESSRSLRPGYDLAGMVLYSIGDWHFDYLLWNYGN